MNCGHCGSYRLRVKNCYQAGPRAKTHRMVCERCGMVHTAVTLIRVVGPVSGQGAASLAKRLRSAKKEPAP